MGLGVAGGGEGNDDPFEVCVVSAVGTDEPGGGGGGGKLTRGCAGGLGGGGFGS